MIFIYVAVISFATAFLFLYGIRRYLTSSKLSSGDTYFHLYIAQHLQRNNWNFPKALQKVTFDEGGNTNYNYLTYPPLLHYIIALFPYKHHLNVAKHLNLAFIAVLCSLASTSVYYLSTNLWAAVIAGLIVIFNFSVFELAVLFTPRPLGLLCYSLVVFVTIFFPNNVLALIAITLLVSLITLSHKFAVQILVIALIPYALSFGNLLLLLALGTGVLLSILVSRGFYLKILKEHLGWLYFYSKHPPQAKVSAKLKQIFVRNPWILLIVVSVAIFFIQGNLQLGGFMGRTIYWCFVTLGVALVVSIPRLAFLGEEYRYIEYSVLPVGIIGGLAIASWNPWILAAALATLPISAYALSQYKKYLIKTNSLTNPQDVSSYKSLKEYAANNLLVIPHTRTLEVGYFTQLQVIHGVRTKSLSIQTHLEHLLNSYNINYVVKFKKIDPYQTFETLTKMMKSAKILDVENFELYRLEPLPN